MWRLLMVLVVGAGIPLVNSLAVMSVDLGSEWIKIGVVSPGLPMETVLNRESKRKTPSAIAFHDGQRIIGEDALNIAVRFPAKTFVYFTNLIGKKFQGVEVEEYRRRFPYVNIVEDERGGVGWRSGDLTFTTEELVAMLLSECRAYTEEFTKQPVTEAVIVVPPYFDQNQRIAVMTAGRLAGLKILQLINSNLAAALNYGIFRRKDFNETAQHLLLYDMGASATIATVVSYQVTKQHGESVPSLSVLGVGYDTTLGGLEMQLRLREHLAQIFNEKKLTEDIRTFHRSMAKLFKEAGRVKNVLSANQMHQAQVESLTPDHDFRSPINRDDFDQLCGDLYERVPFPAQQALDSAHLTIDVIDQVILIGAGTRVPKVQEKLAKYLGRELGKSLNTDEASSMGAVYKGADLSTGFKVKKFGTKDGCLRGVVVDFSRTISTTPTPTLKLIRRTLFPPMNPFPQKKIMTFNKNEVDFTFDLNYADQGNISQVEVKGVEELIGKNGLEGYRGVKAHFNLDESGIIHLTHVESVFEKNVTEEDGTLSKVASAFSNLFGNSTKSPENETEAAEKPVEPKPTLVKEVLEIKITQQGVVDLSEEKFREAKGRLHLLNEEDKLRTQLERARNNLEGLVGEMNDKITSEEFGDMVNENEREEIGGKCSELSDWLYSDDPSPPHSTQNYEEKFKNLKQLTRLFTDRIREHKSRPDALQALNQMLNISRTFLKSSKELNPDDQYFTVVEVETLEKLVKETEEWLSKLEEEQEKLKLWEEPKLTVRGIAEKVDGLDREVKYMLNKARVERLRKEREAAKEKEKESTIIPPSDEAPPGDTSEIPVDVDAESIVETEIPQDEEGKDHSTDPTDPPTEHTEL